MLLLVSIIKLVAEIALLAFAGQFVLGLLAGAKRESNFFYRLFDILTKPFVRAMRAVAPRAVLDRHIPIAAFVALASVWIVATIAKINVCLQVGMQMCR
jgi:hypothetical protein